jgi:ribosomal protein S18 acetylase RimI-like enzyme
MEVRRAAREDLVAIGRLAHAATWESCTGLLKPTTISAALETDYSPSSLKRRLLAGRVVVAVDETGAVMGFADVAQEAGRVRLASLSTEPTFRRRGVGRMLIDAVKALSPTTPLCADILLGNLDGERFCEASGFVPGEVIQRRVFGEDVVERRWWCPAAR